MNTLIQKLAISWVITLLLVWISHWNSTRINSLAQIKIIYCIIWILNIIYILLFSELLLKGVLLTYNLCIVVKNIPYSVHLLGSNSLLSIKVFPILFRVKFTIVIIKYSLFLKIYILVKVSKRLIIRLSIFNVFGVHALLILKIFILKILRAIVF